MGLRGREIRELYSCHASRNKLPGATVGLDSDRPREASAAQRPGEPLAGEIEEKAESSVDRLRILERLSYVGIEQDHVRPLLVAL